MFAYEIRIPKERVAVLIGAKGTTKREIESALKVKLAVDSKEGLVSVSGEEALSLYTAQQVVKAIARGFNPDVALRLLKQDWAFELLDLTDYTTTSKQQERLKGRVIGQGGKSRSTIESLAECNISVYGKTIALIAPVETLTMAKQAIEALLEGAKHAGVYKKLERQRRDLRMSRVMGAAPGEQREH